MKVHKIFCALSTGWLSAISIVVALAPEAAFSQASFFQGKTVDRSSRARPWRDRRPAGAKPCFPSCRNIYRATQPYREQYMPGGGSRRGSKSHLQELAS